jgi:hypothetical protein
MAVVEGRPPSRTPDPGWYADPGGQGLRWWDGTAWTEHVRADDSTADPTAASGRYPLRYELLDRWPLLLGAAVAIAAVAVAAILLLGGGNGASGGPQEQDVRGTVDGFLTAVANGDEQDCERYIDANAEAMKRYLRLAQGVPDSQSTCGFVGATGSRVGSLSVSKVTVKGSTATVTFEGNPTVMHLSNSGGRWVIDGIS